ATLSGGQATFSTSSLSKGNHAITASYSGDANFITSTSIAYGERVKNGATTTVISSTAVFTQTVNDEAPVAALLQSGSEPDRVRATGPGTAVGAPLSIGRPRQPIETAQVILRREKLATASARTPGLQHIGRERRNLPGDSLQS